MSNNGVNTLVKSDLTFYKKLTLCVLNVNVFCLKFRFSKKATKFETISHMIKVKSNGRLFQIFEAFSECPNFIQKYRTDLIKEL